MAIKRLRGPAILESTWIEDAEVTYEDGRIIEVSPAYHARCTYRFQDAIIGPGLIDTHVHGGGGLDVMDGHPDALRGLARYLARTGTTGFLATTMSAEAELLEKVLAAITHAAIHPARNEAALLGVHMEGPFLHPRRCGAQNRDALRHPDIQEMRRYLRQAPIRVVTMAPELPGAHELGAFLRAHRVIPSMGHTDSDYEGARAAFGQGFHHVTHLFNGMPPLHHRDPGPAAAALFAPNVLLELICDGIHVHRDWIRWLHTLAADRIILVTDAMRAAGLADGTYDLGGQPVVVQEGIVRTGEGRLAGSTLTLLQAVKNYRTFTGADWPEAFRAASLAPAKMLGLADRKGSLAEGKDADIIVFRDARELVLTIREGHIAWSAENTSP